MQAIEAELPATDGLACFNRMYLEVTRGVSDRVGNGTFGDPGFVSHLDVVFANLYFEAVNALSGPPSTWPTVWRPLLEARNNGQIDPLQFALAGMNAHINHDLPIAVVSTCTDLVTAPEDGSHHSDYQKVDSLLDAEDQSVRESFESRRVRAADHRFAGIANVVCNWSMNDARDVAWQTALALWELRDRPAGDLLADALGRTVSMASRGLLVVL